MNPFLQNNSQKTANDYFNQGNQFKQSEQYQDAVEAYEKAIELNPNFSWYYHNLAEVFIELEEWEKASSYFRQACEINPNSEWSFYQLGEALVQQGELEEAIAAFKKAIELNPEYPEFYSSLGEVLWQLEQLDEAETCLKKAVELDPDSIKAYQNLWEVLAKQGKGEQGLVYLQKAIELNPASWELQQKLGEVWHGKRDLEAAEKQYTTVIHLNSSYHWGYYKLGVILREQGKLEEAIAYLQKAVELEPSSAICHHYLGHSLAVIQEWEAAIKCYRKAIELSPDSAIIYQHLGDALYQLKKWNEAIIQYKKCTELDPSFLENPKKLALALHQSEQWDEAVSYYLKTLELYPNTEEIQSSLAHALLKQDLPNSKNESDWQAQFSEAIDAYTLWRKANEPREADLYDKQKTVDIFGYKPLISVIMPVYNTPEKFLREAIESVISQIYPYWELCIADDASTKPSVINILEEYASQDSRIKVIYRKDNGHISVCSNSALELATGEFIALLDHDDLLTPDALYEVALLLNYYPDADMIYSDEDKIDSFYQDQLKNPFFKPEWSPDSFLSRMYTCHLGIYRKLLIQEISGWRVGYEGSQDYDLVLRVSEKTNKIYHIPKVLYHWRMHIDSAAGGTQAKPYAYEAGQKALQEAIDRRGEKGIVKNVPGLLGNFIVRYHITYYKKISIIISTCDLSTRLDKCLESIFTYCIYPNYEIIIVDYGRSNQNPDQFISKWNSKCDNRCQYIKYVDLDTAFNFSKINNYGVKNTEGEYLLFLNENIEFFTDDCINAMVEQVQRSSIGAVSVLLLDQNRTVKHAGFLLGVGGIASYSHRQFPETNPGYFSYLKCINNVSAVTADCLMCRREVFEQVEGFDERLAVTYSDIDLCLKILSQGYKNLYLPYAVVDHHESKNIDDQDIANMNEQQYKEQKLIQSRWQKFIDNDPYYSPHLTKRLGDYSLNISTQRVQVREIVKLAIDSELFWGWHLDNPQPMQEVTVTYMNIEGWILGKKQKVIYIEIVYGNQVIKKIPVELHRLDVANAYPELTNTSQVGFSTAINATKISAGSQLKIQAILEDQSSIALAVIEIGE